MTLLYENNDTHDAAVDAVSSIDLNIKCHPGQVDSVIDFLTGIEKQAGVYHASFEVDKKETVSEEVKPKRKR